MKVEFLSQAGKLLKEHKQYRRRLIVFLSLAVIVAYVTITALKLYGQAMTHKVDILDCQYTAHEHTDECFEPDEAGNLGEEPVCGYADYVIHVHNEDCYKGEDELACTLEEHEAHEHTEACWETEMVLVCGEEAAEDVANAEGTENGEFPSDPESTADAEAPSDSSQAESTEEAVSTEAESEESVQPQEPELICELEEHTHDETCIGQMLVCEMDGQPDHEHTVECVDKDGNIICGLEEHIHDVNCVDAEGNLICGAEEHRHVVVCYDAEGNEICGKAPHTHGEGCIDAEGNIVCGQEEHEHFVRCYGEGNICGKEEHAHGEECYTIPEVPEEIPESEPVVQEPEAESQEESSQELEAERTDGGEAAENSETAHVHTDACYEEVKTLVCDELELHTHDNSCYTEDCFDAEGNLIEGSKVSCGLLQLEEHTHTRTEDENSCIKEVELTPEEVEALNQGAKLHIHKEDCYDSDGILICGHDATHAHMPECFDDAGKAICGYGTASHVHEKRCYDKEDGSLVCGYETASHVHDDSCVDVNGSLQCGYEAASHVHDDNCVDAEGKLSCGYETAAHVHEESCYDEEGNQLCGYETAEHVHDDGCYDGERNLICGHMAAHVHNMDCYDLSDPDGKLICGFEESENDETENDGNENNSDVNGNSYICGKEEHAHNEECWDVDKNLLCDLEEHTHTEDCFSTEEWAQVEKVNQLISNLPSIEEIKEKLAGFRESEGQGEENQEESKGNVEKSEESPEESTKTLEEVIEVVDESEEDSAAEDATVESDENAAEDATLESSEATGEEGGQSDDEYVEALLAQIKEAYDAYMSLDSEQQAQVENVEYLMALWDSLDEIREHTRGEGSQGGMEGKTYYCGKEEHTHSVKCYDAENNLSCELEEHTHEKICSVSEEELAQIEKVNELIAALPFVDEITERFNEFQEAGEESEEAFNEYVTALVAQIQGAYIAYLSLDSDLQEYVTGAQYLLELRELIWVNGLEANLPTGVPNWAALAPVGDQGGGVVLELLYSDGLPHKGTAEDADYGEVHYVSETMSGYIKIYPNNLQGNGGLIDKVTVSLYFPKEYVEKNSIHITPPSEGFTGISAVTEDAEYYKIDFTLENYKLTQAMIVPFKMKFINATVPESYKLKIFGTITAGNDGTAEAPKTEEITYKPKYDEPIITKYVNTNRFESMKDDYTKVSGVVVYEDENKVLYGNPYASFWYKLDCAKGYEYKAVRAYGKITLIDTLPTYTDKDGVTQYAKFVESENPGWTAGPGEHEVQYVFDFSNIPDHNNNLYCAEQVELRELKLQFPNCKFSREKVEQGSGFMIADATNSVKAVCEPKKPNPLYPEENDIVEDDIIFRMTNQEGGDGTFTKWNSVDTISDDKDSRSSLYRWVLAFDNKSNQEFDNLIIRDGAGTHYTCGGAHTHGDECYDAERNLVCKEKEHTHTKDCESPDLLDDRLKFHSIVFNNANMSNKEEVDRRLVDNLDYLIAYTYEGGNDVYDLKGASEFFKETDTDRWTLELLKSDPDKEYKGFEIYFKKDFKMKPGEKIQLWPYSTFRNPELKRFEGPEGNPRNVYWNQANIEYHVADTRLYRYMWSSNKFTLIETRENVWITKDMLGYNGDLEYPTKDSNGNWDYSKSFDFCLLNVRGALSEDKKYEDLRIVDLLPEALEVEINWDGTLLYASQENEKYVRYFEIVDNYHNSGRTAIIFYLNVDEVRQVFTQPDGYGGTKPAYIGFRVRVKQGATRGTFVNDVYLVSKDFEEPTEFCTLDQYDIDEDGSTDDYIRWDHASGNIKTSKGVHAEKYIAKADVTPEGNGWRTSILSLRTGEPFQYKLSIVNETEDEDSDLVVYDVLPQNGDKSINNLASRDSEFTVKLSGPIVPPEHYTVSYTKSMAVYSKSMGEILTEYYEEGEDSEKTQTLNQVYKEVWSDNACSWEEATAFKIEADQGTILGKERVSFIIPVKVTSELSQESVDILNRKESVNAAAGTVTCLEATNSFGYCTKSWPAVNNMESNYVKAQISFAGFVVKKTNGEGKTLAGAEFKLEKLKETSTETDSEEDSTGDSTEGQETGSDSGEGQDESQWIPVGPTGETGKHVTLTTGADGTISVKGLTEGTYRLTETKEPEGHERLKEPITITFTLNETTMEYDISVVGEGLGDPVGDGSIDSPFIVINEAFYALPETGGTGSKLYTMAGAIVAVLGVGFLYKRKFRERRG